MLRQGYAVLTMYRVFVQACDNICGQHAIKILAMMDHLHGI